ncbi:hypothetical protein QBC33DRAFT_208590 [Phialemonium atrogriseum]|uniref:Secreted protein n=1 Tax=Phialemonium atrogriseum TaxID=1093897 RepID=A0AAJ0BTV9_9PEZI|nr:uncharacterized protein QBC33DRAFT_208590 [Phialemonium atrogriseum]KAK1764131.1 hypothetical protein QBC33DRAFT_208590 [Phialemonium atrogriseum]
MISYLVVAFHIVCGFSMLATSQPPKNQHLASLPRHWTWETECDSSRDCGLAPSWFIAKADIYIFLSQHCAIPVSPPTARRSDNQKIPQPENHSPTKTLQQQDVEHSKLDKSERAPSFHHPIVRASVSVCLQRGRACWRDGKVGTRRSSHGAISPSLELWLFGHLD